ncbi:MFS transporter [Streptomyces sp. NPDC100445]|uniref:MFS transporter n=1 Tax=Streptomyces sp. NPDC100445 TaxID=3366102 RepID=UPI0037FE8EB8
MSYLRLLRNGRIAAVWASQLLAVMGGRLYALAVMWLMWQTTHNGLLMGLVAVVESLPYVLVGWLGRRLLSAMASLRRLALVEMARAAAAAVLPVLWAVSPGARTAWLLGVAGLMGCLGALFDPVLPGLLPRLVDMEHYQAVMGLFDLTVRIARIAGPGLVGALLGVLKEVDLYLLTAGGFAISSVALGLIGRASSKRATAATAPTAPTGPLPALRPLLRQQPTVAAALSLHAVGIFASSAPAIGMPILLTTQFHGDAGAYGLLTAITTAGAMVGNLATGNLRLGGWMIGAYCFSWGAQGVALAAMGAAQGLWVLWLLAGCSGLVSPLSGVSLNTFLAHRFDEAARLSVLAGDQMVIRAAGTLSMLVVPLYVQAAPRTAFVVTGLALSAYAILVLQWARRAAPARQSAPAEAG